MATYRLFPSTQGPSSPVSYSGNFLAGVGFIVTEGGCYLEGFWWWVCPTGQPTKAQTFCLWELTDSGPSGGVLITGTTVTSGTLTAGEWNYVPLQEPVPLTQNVPYIAQTGLNGPFPDTNDFYGTGPGSAGITSGPLFAYSDPTGTDSFILLGSSPNQGTFSTASPDPTKDLATGGSQASNFWMDVQVGTTPPAGTSYRLWPNYPQIPGTISNDTNEQSFGTEFLLSEACTLDNIWFYSPTSQDNSGPATVLPAQCAIFDVATQTMVSGTLNTSPAWSGASGSGWVACAYKGVTLPPGDYKVCVYMTGGHGGLTYQENTHYFGSGEGDGFNWGINGITNGPLSSPNVADASSCINDETNKPTTGNSTYSAYNLGFIYPDLFDIGDNGEVRWVDVEVTPAGTVTPPITVVNSGAFLVFFP